MTNPSRRRSLSLVDRVGTPGLIGFARYPVYTIRHTLLMLGRLTISTHSRRVHVVASLSTLYTFSPVKAETMAEQQVNLTDLDPAQLQEVKKQLDQVSYKKEATRRGC